MGGLDCSTAACPDQCVQPVKSSEIDTACRCHVAQTGNLACLSDLRVLEVCAENPPRKFCSPIASTPTGLSGREWLIVHNGSLSKLPRRSTPAWRCHRAQGQACALDALQYTACP